MTSLFSSQPEAHEKSEATKYMESTIRMFCGSWVEVDALPGNEVHLGEHVGLGSLPGVAQLLDHQLRRRAGRDVLADQPGEDHVHGLAQDPADAITESTTYTVISANTRTMPSLYGDISPTRRLADGQKCSALRTGAPPLHPRRLPPRHRIR